MYKLNLGRVAYEFQVFNVLMSGVERDYPSKYTTPLV